MTSGQPAFSLRTATLDEMRTWPSNPKDHDIGALQRSFDKFGYVSPIVVNALNGMVLAGHGRIEALSTALDGGEQPPDHITAVNVGDTVTWLVPYVEVAVDPALHGAYVVADNRVTELGGWDWGTLPDVLTELHKMDLLDATGFDADDLDDIRAMLGQLPQLTPRGRAEGTEHGDEALWPTIAVRVPPEVFRQWQDLVQRHGGDECKCLTTIINAAVATPAI